MRGPWQKHCAPEYVECGVVDEGHYCWLMQGHAGNRHVCECGGAWWPGEHSVLPHTESEPTPYGVLTPKVVNDAKRLWAKVEFSEGRDKGAWNALAFLLTFHFAKMLEATEVARDLAAMEPFLRDAGHADLDCMDYERCTAHEGRPEHSTTCLWRRAKQAVEQ